MLPIGIGKDFDGVVLPLALATNSFLAAGDFGPDIRETEVVTVDITVVETCVRLSGVILFNDDSVKDCDLLFTFQLEVDLD